MIFYSSIEIKKNPRYFFLTLFVLQKKRRRREQRISRSQPKQMSSFCVFPCSEKHVHKCDTDPVTFSPSEGYCLNEEQKNANAVYIKVHFKETRLGCWIYIETNPRIL